MANFDCDGLIAVLREDVEKVSVLTQELVEDFVLRVAMAADRGDTNEILFLCGADGRRAWLKGCAVCDLLDMMIREIDKEGGSDISIEAIHGAECKARERGAAAATGAN